MTKIFFEKQFKKDYKKVTKQGKPIELLDNLIKQIAKGQKIPDERKDHPLIGVWKGARECHIAPNWLLIYYIEDDAVTFSRTGSHSELFKKY